MANETKTGSAVGGNAKTGSGHGSSATVTRKRKEYAHEMTGAERFAYQTVLSAKNACSRLAVAIQEGKGCTPDVIESCTQLVNASGRVLFKQG